MRKVWNGEKDKPATRSMLILRRSLRSLLAISSRNVDRLKNVQRVLMSMKMYVNVQPTITYCLTQPHTQSHQPASCRGAARTVLFSALPIPRSPISQGLTSDSRLRPLIFMLFSDQSGYSRIPLPRATNQGFGVWDWYGRRHHSGNWVVCTMCYLLLSFSLIDIYVGHHLILHWWEMPHNAVSSL